jgi:hypothetical protein
MELKIIFHEIRYKDPMESGYLVASVNENGDESFVDYDWHKGCVYIPAFPPPLWGLFKTEFEAMKAIESVGMLDRLQKRAA